MRRMLRRLDSLERRWHDHPVHARLSKGALKVRKELWLGQVEGWRVHACLHAFMRACILRL